MRPIGATLALVAATVIGCSSGDDADDRRGIGGSGGANGSEPITSEQSPGAGGGSGMGADPSAAVDGPPGNASAETLCDGIDDDGNGVIDDVDVGGDGICDCLSVATLGQPGGAGNGSVFSAWLSMRSTNGATDLADAVLTDELLAPFQVLIIQNVSGYDAYAPSEVETLQRWVEAGGGVMTLIGYAGADEANNVNGLLAPYGLSYGTVDVMKATFDLATLASQTAPVVEWPGHPLSMGVTAVGMDNGKPVLGNAAIVATGEGHTLAMVTEAGAGKVFLWGDEWITFDSEWVGRPEFQIELFWVNILGYLTPAEECQVAVPPALLL